MTVFEFETSLHCQSCVRTLAVFLAEDSSISKWNVDLEHPKNVLRVEGNELEAKAILKMVEEAGFDAKLIA